MIQRIQTIWLLLAAILVCLTWKLPVYTGLPINGAQPISISTLNGGFDWLTNFLTMGSGVLAFAAIFLFKNRKLQIRFTVVALLLQVLLVARYILIIRDDFQSGTVSLTAALIAISLFLLIQAIRCIRRDQHLLEETDRLR
jgi:hypothetical protein